MFRAIAKTLIRNKIKTIKKFADPLDEKKTLSESISQYEKQQKDLDDAFTAAEEEKWDIVFRYIARQKIPPNAIGKNGMGFMHYAVEQGNDDNIIRLIRLKVSFTVDPVPVAFFDAKRDEWDLICCFLENGLMDINAIHNGMTLLDMADQNRNVYMYQYLRARGAESGAQDVEEEEYEEYEEQQLAQLSQVTARLEILKIANESDSDSSESESDSAYEEGIDFPTPSTSPELIEPVKATSPNQHSPSPEFIRVNEPKKPKRIRTSL